jgi:hypothetical protein
MGATITRPNLVNWDATFNSKDIRGYNNRWRGVKSNIPVNPRSIKRKKGVNLETLIEIFTNVDMLLRDSLVGSGVIKRSLWDMKDWRILLFWTYYFSMQPYVRKGFGIISGNILRCVWSFRRR